MDTTTHFMRRCLELAQKGKGFTAPNPMVGAILVHKDRIIGEGYHAYYGEAHAEINCLQAVATTDLHLIPESTMYVSLEPCAHFGKTPPCATRLVAEKVKEVVICNKDPFEKVSGRGIDILEQHQIKTQIGLLEQEGLWVNRRFFCFHVQKRPYIILKWAQTQRGFFAPLNRTRFQMSNRHSQQLVHKWRTEEAAILVGTKTAMTDDPQLTARLWHGKQPLRIVIDKKMELPSSLRLFNSEANTWIINELKDAEQENLRFLKIDHEKDLLAQLLSRLYEQQIQSLIVEGGTAVLNSFLEKGLWDEARIFITPDVLQEGIRAPVINNAVHAFSANLDTDNLHMYVNATSKYQYVSGMEL